MRRSLHLVTKQFRAPGFRLSRKCWTGRSEIQSSLTAGKFLLKIPATSPVPAQPIVGHLPWGGVSPVWKGRRRPASVLVSHPGNFPSCSYDRDTCGGNFKRRNCRATGSPRTRSPSALISYALLITLFKRVPNFSNISHLTSIFLDSKRYPNAAISFA